MDAPGKFEVQRLYSIVEKGRLYASARQSINAELSARIREAEILAVEGLGKLFEAIPPNPDSPRGRIEFDPALLANLAADHAYPEWVVSAQLELLIRARHDQWREAHRSTTRDSEDEAHFGSIAAA
jgi:hypothetical protein